MPRVTVCVPTYNRSQLLSETLDSVLKQEYSDFRVVVTDNCSTDNTRDVVEQYRTRDTRVIYHRNRENLGQFGNIDEGIRLTETPYWALLMDDDLWPPDFLKTAVAGLDRHPQASFFSSCAYLATSRSAFPHERPPLFGAFAFIDPIGPDVQYIDREATAALVTYMSIFHPSTFVGRTVSAQRYTPLYSQANWCGDWLFSAQMALEGGLLFAPRLFVFARLHPGAEKTQADNQGLRKAATYEVQEKIFEELNKTGLNDANHWEALATRLGGPAGRHVLRSGILGPCADPAFAPLAVRAFGGSPDKAIHRLRINRRRRKRLKRWIGSLRRQMESLTTFH
jgi:hypothetical protein